MCKSLIKPKIPALPIPAAPGIPPDKTAAVGEAGVKERRRLRRMTGRSRTIATGGLGLPGGASVGRRTLGS